MARQRQHGDGPEEEREDAPKPQRRRGSVGRLEFSAVLQAIAARSRGIRESDSSKFALIKFTRVEIRMVRNKEV